MLLFPCRKFTFNSETFRPQSLHDVAQEEALVRQGVADEALTPQGVIQDQTQNSTRLLCLTS